jgi:hypothetical protein
MSTICLVITIDKQRLTLELDSQNAIETTQRDIIPVSEDPKPERQAEPL